MAFRALADTSPRMAMLVAQSGSRCTKNQTDDDSFHQYNQSIYSINFSFVSLPLSLFNLIKD